MGETELGTFLRAHREAVPPAAVGLADRTRRRTPGLRRAELATLAGVSVDYLTRLEQGRDRSPSTQVLAALAEPLSLSRDERIHLHRLAQTAAGGGGGEWAASLRAAAALGDPHAALLAEELTIIAGARFRDRFEGSAALPSRTGVEQWAHPEVGMLRLAYESLALPDPDELRLVVYLASDEATAAALDRLTNHHPTASSTVAG